MRSRRFVTAAVVAGSVAAGAVAGATLFTPGLGLAQDSTATGSAEDDSSARLCGLGDQLAAAAEAIGIEESALRAALEDGQTIAEVAEANDVEVGAVIAAMVAESEAAIDQAVEDGRLTEAQAEEKRANLEERVTAVVNGEAPLGRGFGRWGPGHDRISSRDGSTDSV
jgi:hypothetical protein